MNKSNLIFVINCVLVLFLLSGCVSSQPPELPSGESPGVPPSPTPGLAPAETATRRPINPANTPEPTVAVEPTSTPVVSKPSQLFAAYRLEPVAGLQPALSQEAIDPQMGNVLVPLALSPEQLELLGRAGVAASPADYPEFHVLYQESERNNLPLFVTSDALLHIFHLTFDQLLSKLEEEVFLAKLHELNQAVLAEATKQTEELKGTAWEDAARRTAAFLAVGSELADPEFQLPAAVEDLAQAELELIEAAGGPAPSPIFTHLKYGEDYSQYMPRGHYTKSEALKQYFKTMMWYGRMTFRLDDPEDPQAGQDETRMALLLALALRDGVAGTEPALELWKVLYDPTAFLVGRSDDLTVEDYLAAMDEVYGAQADLETIADDARLGEFIAATEGLPAPRILGLLSDDYKAMEAVKGLRLMGQRFVPDAFIFQELIHPKVPGRYLPSGLDVMAVMGSERAATWLEQDPTTQNAEYDRQFGGLDGWMAGLSQQDWTETSYNAWLYTLQALNEPAGEGYPLFMQSTAWQDKQLNTSLGSWAELKHDTLLYAKQPYGGLGGCGWPAPPSPVTTQSYVEPVPEVFARIAALAEMTRQGLEGRGLIQLLPKNFEFDPSLGDRLGAIASLALEFKGMAEKELQGQPLSEEDEAIIRSFGDTLEEVVLWVTGEKPEQDPAAIIADVATDPNKGDVLEVGIGNVHEFYVVAPIPQVDGSLALTVARGGIFSYYEFPSQERLTDEAWREKVKEGTAPDQPAFTSGLMVDQAARPDVQAAIYRFQRDWVNWLYYTVGYSGDDGCPISPEFRVKVDESVLDKAQKAIAALREQNQYEGRQLIQSDYLSVQPSEKNPRNLIVTVRETWSDYLVTYSGSDPFTWYGVDAEPISARRGPYTVDVAYELAPLDEECRPGATCYEWMIAGFEELTGRPEWGAP